MTRPGHVHLRLTAANLDGLDRWAKAHGLTRNDSANQLFERFLGGEEMGRIQRTMMLAESLTKNLETLDEAHTQTAITAGSSCARCGPCSSFHVSSSTKIGSPSPSLP